MVLIIFLICSLCAFSLINIAVFIKRKKYKNEYFQYLSNIGTLKNEIKNLNGTYNQAINSIQSKINDFQKDSRESINNYNELLELNYNNAEEQYKCSIDIINKQKELCVNDLQILKNTIYSAQESLLRQKEIEDKVEFYSIQLEENDKREIQIIKSIEHQLSNPRPLNMIIWTQYYSNKANELCGRVLGKNRVTGVYKITNIKNNMSYIGQAVDVKTRFKDHMKCGLGIDTPSGNRLYKAMSIDGLENFTFELIEECEQELLNSKERFYIDFYNTYHAGYNSNQGITDSATWDKIDGRK